MKVCVVCTLKYTNSNLIRNAGGILSKMDKDQEVKWVGKNKSWVKSSKLKTAYYFFFRCKKNHISPRDLANDNFFFSSMNVTNFWCACSNFVKTIQRNERFVSVVKNRRSRKKDVLKHPEHILFCNRTPDFEGFKILAINNNNFKVTLMENILINKDHSPLNNNKQSLPLELFDN